MRPIATLSRWSLLSAILLALGCANDPASIVLQPAIVTGEVTLDGRTLTSGTVTFLPVGPDAGEREPGIARIGPEGTYWVGNTDLSKAAGLAPGRYKVTVMAMTPRPDGPAGPISRLATPERYANLATTPFDAVISAGQNRVRLDLVSAPSDAERDPGAIAKEPTAPKR